MDGFDVVRGQQGVEGGPPWVGPWTLPQLKHVQPNGLRVLSTFSGGGGSSMGYKLAGYEVVGAVEIDKKICACYERNLGLAPDCVPIQDFTRRLREGGMPERLRGLDVLDGSPPCSSFSMAGNRAADWGKARVFREGQAEQVLDSLFMQYVDLASVIRPRVCVAENVKGLIIGQAKGYAIEVVQAFAAIGYDCQVFLLNASRMGVPQARERVFFIARRRDLQLATIKLTFNERPISAQAAIFHLISNNSGKRLSHIKAALWRKTKLGKALSSAHPRRAYFNSKRLSPNKPFPTLDASEGSFDLHWSESRRLTDAEVVCAQSFPDDYNFGSLTAKYVCGMSVPPRMMQRLSLAVAGWLGAGSRP